jgi:Cdc6-like AAA superfamily ATPase
VYKELNMKSAQFNRLLRSARNGATGLEGSPYVIEDGRICLRKRTPDGDMLVSLTNFTAEIIEEVTLDDGENQAKELRIAGKLDNGTPLPVARVPIDQFANMKWPTKCWGARAIINAGWGTTDRVREAIQRLSTEIAFRHVFQHLGWTEVEGKHVYLTHAGAVGLGDRVTVELPPSLEAYALPCFPQDPEAALTTSLKFLHLAPLTVTVPILAVVYGAPLVSFISAGYTLWLYGPSGTGKTTILTEALRHYGAGR